MLMSTKFLLKISFHKILTNTEGSITVGAALPGYVIARKHLPNVSYEQTNWCVQYVNEWMSTDFELG